MGSLEALRTYSICNQITCHFNEAAQATRRKNQCTPRYTSVTNACGVSLVLHFSCASKDSGERKTMKSIPSIAIACFASSILPFRGAWAGEVEVYSATVQSDRVWTDGASCAFSTGFDPDADATVEWEDNIESTGWAMQRVRASEEASARNSEVAAFAAGCVQGYASAFRMTQYWRNYAANEYKDGQPPQKLLQFMADQRNFTGSIATGAV